MPRLIRMYITQVAIGFGLSAVFVAGLLWGNVANLWHLVSNDSAGILAVAMLWIFNGIVFASVQFAIAVMRLQDRDIGGRGPRLRNLEPVPVRQEATRKRKI